MSAAYPCPCCGYLVFDEPLGSYDICPYCFWEDDALQLEFATTHAAGPNKVTLLEAQRNHQQVGACTADMRRNVRKPPPDAPRDPAWRPIEPERDSFEDWEAEPLVRAPDDADLYYWRPTFWRRPR